MLIARIQHSMSLSRTFLKNIYANEKGGHRMALN
jgi:hypothetical protein